MKVRDLVQLSTRMFKARTSRTVLTILGMGIGISAILFLVSLGYGIQKVLLETITTTDSLLSLDVVPGKLEEKRLDNNLILEIENMSGVANISPVYQSDAQVESGGLVSEASAMIVDTSFLDLNGTKISGGEKLDNSQPDGIVITTAFAKIFSKEPTQMLGEEIKFSLFLPESGTTKENKSSVTPINKKFKIIGFTEREQITMFVNNLGVKDFISIPEYSQLKVKCKEAADVDRLKETLVNEGLSATSLNDVVKQAEKVFKVVRLILAFFGVIALVVSAIGMFNTMTVTLLERTEEIGIMKSIGASARDIFLMFVFESTIMGFLGGVSGLMIGYVNSKIFNLVVNLIASRFGGESVSLFFYPLWFLGFIVFTATLVGFFTGIVPAKRAGNINPLEALRYK